MARYGTQVYPGYTPTMKDSGISLNIEIFPFLAVLFHRLPT